ncbi:MAG: hypothetical protein IKM33_01045 [Clostridia bacterium]|nr:hypothetical protein [Clostridia bacterium]
MTSALKRMLVLTLAFALLISCFAACDIPTEYESETESETAPEEKPIEYTLTLTADKSEATRGESVNLSAVLKAEGAEDIPSEDTEFILVSGSEYASVVGNVLKISETAPHGATVTVQAKEGASYSNTITVKISVPLKSIVISAATDKPTAGQTIVLTKVVDPSDATQTISWTITEGAEFATVAGDALTVSETAPVGTVIKIKAASGDVESNELTLTVRSSVEEIPATAVTVTAPTLNPLVGESVVLTGKITPDNSTDSIRYEIVDGEDFASLSANVLIISKNATAGVVIKVVAYAGDVKSSELVFTVRDTSVAAESIEIFANKLAPLAGQSVVLSKDVNPANTTDTVVWTVIEGSDKAEMVGDVLMIKDTAVAGDVIKVQATAGDVESNVLKFVVASSEIKATKVTLSADYFNLLPGQTMIIKSTIEPADSTDHIILSITEGAQHASLSGNVLIISENAPAGTVVKVVAKADTTNSNELVFTVRDTSKPATKVEISADNLSPIAGHSVTINVNITPTDTTDKLSWVIVQGDTFASMSGNVLVVKPDVEKDSRISVKAVVGSVESNVLTFTVRPATEEIKVESIQLSANTEVLRGQAVIVNKIVNPTNANQEILWQFVEGANYATFNGDTLIISSEARTGTRITIKAVAGDVESNALTFIVQPSQEEINASRFYIDLDKDIFTVDKKGTAAAPVLVATVYNYNYEQVTDKVLEFRVISGAEYLGITASGANCSFTDLKGHGTAIVEIRIQGTDVVETAEVNVIVPPDAVVLPEVFAERTDIEYSFSMIDHTITGISGNVVEVAGMSSLPFVPTVRGTGIVCKDLAFNFRHESGATGDEVAVYENGAITFKKTGKVVVTVSSASGSKVEATISYTFNINEGYNVNTFEELWLVVRNDIYQGQQINFAVFEKPDGSANNYQYGYDLVPLVALKPQNDQTIDEILRGPRDEVPAMGSNRIQAVNKSLYINGNNHKIDASQMRVFTEVEYDDYCNRYGVTDKLYNISSLLSAEPWNAGGDVSAGTNNNKTYSVNLYNLETKGNQPIDYDPALYRKEGSTEMNIGCYTHGINIGSREYNCHYYIDANNITSSAFYAGMSFLGIVGNGKVSNVHVYNCFSTGIFSRSNIMTFENLTFGPCGATGMELAPEECNEAGLNDNEIQQVTISGTINTSSNLNAGNTTYFQNYKVGGATVPEIINGNVGGIVTVCQNEDPISGEAAGWNALGHIQNESDQFILVSLLFNDLAHLQPNTSKVIYPSYQDGGIITVDQLVTDVLTKSERDPSTGAITKMYVDTTHQFIEMPIEVPSLGTVGTALFYNHNYGK